MQKFSKIITIVFIILCFLVFLSISYKTKDYKECTVKDVINPCLIILDNNEQYKLSGFDVFDSEY